MYLLFSKMKYLALFLLITFLQQVLCEEDRYECDDALRKETNLCHLWKRDGLCSEKNVRSFCQRSCNECDGEEYVGCFHDGRNSELKFMPSDYDVTIRSCLDTCETNAYTYAGLRDGKYCMCGNDYGSYGEVIKRSGCSKRCGGLAACGGALENAIYKTKYGRVSKRDNIDKIQELILGKGRKSKLSQRHEEEQEKKHLKIPKTREWNFMEWLRRYTAGENKK